MWESAAAGAERYPATETRQDADHSGQRQATSCPAEIRTFFGDAGEDIEKRGTVKQLRKGHEYETCQAARLIPEPWQLWHSSGPGMAGETSLRPKPRHVGHLFLLNASSFLSVAENRHIRASTITANPNRTNPSRGVCIAVAPSHDKTILTALTEH